MKLIRILSFFLGMALVGLAAAGDLTRGLEIAGGENTSGAFGLKRVETPEEGVLMLQVDVEGVRELQGYGLALHFDPARYEFVEAQEADDNLLETGSGTPRLFLATSPTPGRVVVGTMKVDGQAAAGDGGLVTFTFRAVDAPRMDDFQVSDGVLVDLSGKVDAVRRVEVLDSKSASSRYSLDQNAPNPFNPTTAIAYQIPEPGQVKLTVYNMLGQEVRTLVDTPMDAGAYTVSWDGRDNQGHRIASGVYMYRMEAGGFSQVRRMLLLK